MRKNIIPISHQAPGAIDFGFCPVMQASSQTFVLENTKKDTVSFRYLIYISFDSVLFTVSPKAGFLEPK
jgi:hypothetical protein